MHTTQPAAESTTRWRTATYGGLAADDWGRDDDRAPLILLHGLTFDRAMWRGIVEEVQRQDPGRRVVSPDLPGHGESPDQASYDLPIVVQQIHSAVRDAALDRPVVVGHSAGGSLATMYGAGFPARGVVNVDASPVIAPFAELVKSLSDQLRGPGFEAVWRQVFVSSFHAELLPADAQELVSTHGRAQKEVVLGYWRQPLEEPVDQMTAEVDRIARVLAATRVPYLHVAGAQWDPDTRRFVDRSGLNATVEGWEGTGHFPHLAHPARFAELLKAAPYWT